MADFVKVDKKVLLCYYFGHMISDTTILDKVLQSQEIYSKQHISPSDIVNQLLKLLPSRESEILRLRFGIDGNMHKTLEIIGQQFRITRERVRQIERQSIEKLRSSKVLETIGKDVLNVVHHTLRIHGSVRRQHSLLEDLLALSGDSAANRSSLILMIERLFSDTIESVEDTRLHPAWKIRGITLDLYHQFIATVTAIFEEVQSPLPTPDLMAHIKQSDFYNERLPEFHNLVAFVGDREHQPDLIDRILHSYLDLAVTLKQNPFGEWGLSSWHSVRPKRMSDKIYLVLKKHSAPLHFREIAEYINKIKFDHKQAHPPTVHNELILDSRFVLVGRGLYALAEWGYKPGVVADVVAHVLQHAGRPLTREEIIAEVGKQRLVKKGTILLALTNKEKFQRLPDGTLTLVHQTPLDYSAPPEEKSQIQISNDK